MLDNINLAYVAIFRKEDGSERTRLFNAADYDTHVTPASATVRLIDTSDSYEPQDIHEDFFESTHYRTPTPVVLPGYTKVAYVWPPTEVFDGFLARGLTDISKYKAEPGEYYVKGYVTVAQADHQASPRMLYPMTAYSEFPGEWVFG